MTTVGVAEYDVLLSRSKLQAEVSAASRTVETGMAGSARKVESEFAGAAKTALKGFAAFEGFKFGKEAIDGAVSLAQQQQRANVEFGAGVKIVDEYAAHAAKGAGLSERSALQAASAFGTLFHSLGVTDTQSAQMSTTLVQLSADFAALHGTSQEAAVQAITRGLGGMGRGLRQYGIFLTDANLKQEAVNLGLYRGSGALSQAAKTQAAYSLIIKGGATANGAFAASTDGLLGKQKVLSAEWDNAKDKLGADLIPAMKAGVSVGEGLLGVFDALGPGVQQAGLSIVGLVAAGKLLAPVGHAIAGGFSKGAAAVKAIGDAAGGAATAATPLVDAELALAQETALTNIAIEAQEAAIAAGATELEAATIAIEARTAAEQAMAAADAEATASTVGLSAALGPLALALVAVGAAYEGLQHKSSFKIDGNAQALLGATNKELVDFYNQVHALGSEKDLETIGAASLPGLKAMRAAVKAAGGDTTDLDTAIRNVTASSNRASVNAKKFGGDIAGTGDAALSAADDIQKWNKALVDGAAADVQREQDLESAKFAEQDSSDALTQAIKEESKARRAAAGDSDEYRAALAAIERDKRAEAKASRDVAQAEKDLASAREQASRSLRDEVLDNESAIISAERAKLALEDSKDALAKTQDDPRATARQKEQALLDEKDAEIALQQAQNKRGDSAADLAKAEADGVNGAPSVVAAKQQVADAIQAQGDAEKQTADDTRAAAKVISDAKDTEKQASTKLRDALIAEATSQENIAKLAYGAAAGHDAFNASLLRSVALLDPNSPLVKELNDYADMLEYLATVEAGTIGNFPGGPQGHGTGQGETPGRPQGPPHAPGTPGITTGGTGPGGLRPAKIINIGSVHTHQGATAIEVANELAFGTH